MSTRNRIVGLALASAILALPVAAQTSTDELLRTLIREVHQLRLTLEKTTLLGYRGQLLIEQLRAQNNRLASLRADLDAVHDQIENVDREKERIEAAISSLDDELKKRFDDKSRDPLERRMKMLQSSIDAAESRKADLEQRQTEVQGRIDDAEARIDEIQKKIDLLDRDLEEAREPSGNNEER